MPDTAYRYALYFTHAPDSPWWQAGSAWLGRDARSAAADARPLPPSPGQNLLGAHVWASLVADPRRYGWHATLRAPFRLAPGHDLAALRRTVAMLCRNLRAFEMPALAVRDLGGFLALTPQTPSAEIDAAARVCVQALHPYTAPLTPQELTRRRRAPLTPRQDVLLTHWGYPFVLDEFRFHFSLTGPLADLPPAQAHALTNAAHQHFGSLPPARFDALTLFAEPAQGADFTALECVPLR